MVNKRRGRPAGREPSREDDEIGDADDEQMNGFQQEEGFEETCEGVPKTEACPKCQQEDCLGRSCDGACDRCDFSACENLCENKGECKTCLEFEECRIRCSEAPQRCDKRYCEGFDCRTRAASGVDCDWDCANCNDNDCFHWDTVEEEENDQED